MMAGFQAEENLTGRAPKNVRKNLDVIQEKIKTQRKITAPGYQNGREINPPGIPAGADGKYRP